MSFLEYNPNIASTIASVRDEKGCFDGNIKIYTRNIGNAARDEAHTPLADRVLGIIDDILEERPDVVILLEAGRPSGSMSWTEIAAWIEKETGLFYGGIKRINATLWSFGKAFFYNPNTVAVGKFWQHWTGGCDWSGDGFGNDIVTLDVYPVVDKKVLIDGMFTVAAVHFPMKLDARLKTAQWLVANSNLFTVVMGDFNTFEDDGGPEMIKIITAEMNLVSLLPPDVITFKAFPHDLVEVPNEKLESLNSDFVVVGECGPDKSLVLFSSHLDHCFWNVQNGLPKNLGAYVAHVGKITAASDHAPIILKVTYA